MNNNFQKLRKDSFKKTFPEDLELKEVVKEYETHKFLANPISQYIYIYLVNYLLSFSKEWFGRDVKSIKILDWGSGKGHITYFLKNRNVNVISCDILSEASDSTFGQEAPIVKQFNIEVVPLEHPYVLPFENESFDVVISMGVLEHVPQDLNSLKEINRILTKKGLFFCFFLPYKLSWTQLVARMRGDFYHDRLYTKAVVDNLLLKSSFKLLDYWHRALLPKNTINYPAYMKVERFDNFLCQSTFLKFLATNIEFVARKKEIGESIN